MIVWIIRQQTLGMRRSQQISIRRDKGKHRKLSRKVVLVNQAGSRKLHRIVPTQTMALREFEGEIKQRCLYRDTLIFRRGVQYQQLDRCITFFTCCPPRAVLNRKSCGSFYPCDCTDQQDMFSLWVS